MSFSFQINLNGVSAAGGSLKLIEGYYNATISECYVDASRNANRVLFKLAITDTPYNGTQRTTGLNMPKSTDDKVRFYWRAALESCGYTPAQLDNPNGFALSPDLFTGRPCTVYYKPKVEDAIVDQDRYDKLNFLTKADWDLRKKVFDSQPKAPVAKTAGTVPSATSIPSAIPTPQAGFAGPQTTTQDLMGLLRPLYTANRMLQKSKHYGLHAMIGI